MRLPTVLLALVVLVVGCGGAPPPREPANVRASAELKVEDMATSTSVTGLPGARIASLGAFSCDFTIDLSKLTESLGADIERDRIFLQKHELETTVPTNPGMIQKHIPITFIPGGPTAFAGGRYLFQGRAQAETYESYIKVQYTYPGNFQFLARPEFSNAECRDWTTLLAWNFVPVVQHTAMRTERFDTGLTTAAEEIVLAVKLLAAAPGILQTASARGYGEVHLLQQLDEHKVQLVYFQPRLSGPTPGQPDGAAFGKLASDPDLGDPLLATGIARVFDRTSFVLTIWQPFAEGDHGTPSLWPNATASGAPFCGDGVCTPSRGETGTSCPADCAPQCGDDVCQPGENLNACPSDCGDPFVSP